MKRFVIGLVVLAIVGCLLVFFYRTSAPKSSSDFVQGTFGGVSLNIELATTTAEQELGLGNRPSIPDRYGMLFVFPKDDRYGFWMKDTLVPLDMFWLSAQGQVVYMAQNVQPDTYPEAFYPTSPARFVLETNAGFASANNIATGTQLFLQNAPNILQ